MLIVLLKKVEAITLRFALLKIDNFVENFFEY